MKIAFITPYPHGIAPSQRFRFEQYLVFLDDNTIKYDEFSFLSETDFHKLYEAGAIRNLWSVLKGFSKRFLFTCQIAQYDFLFLHREAAPLGFPFFEFVWAKIFRKKIIYDFDDAIWMTDVSQRAWLTNFIRFPKKVSLISKWAFKVSCGNDYLASYASQFNSRVLCNPTTLDLVNGHNGKKEHLSKDQIVIGWTGTHSTLKYLYTLNSVLLKLIDGQIVKLLVIANKEPVELSCPYQYIKWTEEKEVEDLLKMDVGIMPLPDELWTKGKCGFKALQYMSLSIPSVASPVGVNSQIIQHEYNGFLCDSEEMWEAVLVKLISDADLRKEIGSKGKDTVLKKYSVESNKENFLTLFE